MQRYNYYLKKQCISFSLFTALFLGMRLPAITLIPRSQKQAFFHKIAPRYAPQAANSHTAAEQCTPRRPNGGCRQNAASRAGGSVFLNPNSSQILLIFHLVIPKGATEPGQKTLAKERLFQHILSLIKAANKNPNFNIYENTQPETGRGRWVIPYRHWKFVPEEFRV